MKRTKYQVTDSRGQVHTRSSPRVYTHAVVSHHPAYPARGEFPGSEPFSKASWCGRADLAEKQAAMWRHSGFTVEIVAVKGGD